MNKTPEQINQYIHEAMGLCWHELTPVQLYRVEGQSKCNLCTTVNYTGLMFNPNYLEHNSDWTKMVKWSMEQSWWRKFIKEGYHQGTCYTRLREIAFNNDHADKFILFNGIIADLFADPTALATAITEYLEGRDE